VNKAPLRGGSFVIGNWSGTTMMPTEQPGLYKPRGRNELPSCRQFPKLYINEKHRHLSENILIKMPGK
jgi:hypothetical protein